MMVLLLHAIRPQHQLLMQWNKKFTSIRIMRIKWNNIWNWFYYYYFSARESYDHIRHHINSTLEKRGPPPSLFWLENFFRFDRKKRTLPENRRAKRAVFLFLDFDPRANWTKLPIWQVFRVQKRRAKRAVEYFSPLIKRLNFLRQTILEKRDHFL